ncbi:hypothetical protein, partial [Campylobacter geochelonis]|uniref:hypothetical protein n=1 Tax=Campylobacter geochelonis TaxID=1780362 RepID=UPI00094CF996
MNKTYKHIYKEGVGWVAVAENASCCSKMSKKGSVVSSSVSSVLLSLKSLSMAVALALGVSIVLPTNVFAENKILGAEEANIGNYTIAIGVNHTGVWQNDLQGSNSKYSFIVGYGAGAGGTRDWYNTNSGNKNWTNDSAANYSTVIGAYSYTGGGVIGSSAIGAYSAATGNYAIALGAGASEATAENDKVFGQGIKEGAKAGADNSIAIGSQTQTLADAKGSVAIGGAGIREDWTSGNKEQKTLAGAKTIGQGAVAIGQGTVSNNGGVAIGVNINPNADTTLKSGIVAIGADILAKGENSIAIGWASRSNSKDASKKNSIAIGSESLTDGTEAIALGKGANATADYTAAFGTGAKAIAANVIAIGNKAKGLDEGGVAIGANAYAANGSNNSGSQIAIGKDAKTLQRNSIAVGNTAKAYSQKTVSIGGNSKSVADGSVVIGDGASAGDFAKASKLEAYDKEIATARENLNKLNKEYAGNTTSQEYTDKKKVQDDIVTAAQEAAKILREAGGSNMVAIGINAAALENAAIAIGGASQAKDSALAIGYNAKATKNNAISVGYKSAANGISSIAFGDLANVADNKTGTMAIGYMAKGNGDRSMAIGMDTQSEGDYSLALGYHAKAMSNNSISIGRDAGLKSNGAGGENVFLGYKSGEQSVSSTSGQNTFIGRLSGYQSNGDKNLFIGNETGRNITGNKNLVMGSDSGKYIKGNDNVILGSTKTNGAAAKIKTLESSISIGKDSIVETTNATAIGTSAKALNENAIALGTGANATAKNTIAIGTGNVVSGENSGAFGDPNTVSGTGSYSFGNDNTIAQDNTFVLGNGVTTTQANSVVLGNASTDKPGVSVTSSSVKVGDKTLTFSGYAGEGSQTNGVVSVGKVDGERQIVNVAAGEVSATSTDAINGSQLYVTNKVIADFSANPTLTTFNKENWQSALGDGKNEKDSTGLITGKTLNEAIGGIKPVEVAAGSNATVSSETNDGKVTYTVGVVDAPTFTGTVTAPTFKAGDNTLTESGLTIKDGPSITAGGIDAGGKAITNLGTSTDGTAAATNKSVTDAIATAVSDVKGSDKTATVASADGSVAVTSTATGSTTAYDLKLDAEKVKELAGTTGLTDVKTQLESPIKFAGNSGETSKKLGESLTIKGAMTTEADTSDTNVGVFVDATGNVNVKFANAPTFAGTVTAPTFKAGETTLTESGLTIKDGPSITTNGIDAKDKEIKNIAAGTTDNSATTKSQMETAIKTATETLTANDKTATVASADGSVAVTSTATGSTTAYDLKLDAEKVKELAGTTGLTDVKTQLESPIKFAGNSGETSKKLGESLTIKGAMTTEADTSDTNVGVFVDATGNVNVKFANAPTFAGTVTAPTFKAGETTLTESGLTIKDGPSITTNGIDAKDKEIKNIAAGTTDNSATTKSQMETAIKTATETLTANDKTATVASADGSVAVTSTATGSTTAYDLKLDAEKVKELAGTTGLTDVKTQLESPIKFAGNSGETSKKLGESLTIKGAMTTEADTSDTNVGVFVDATGNVNVKFANAPTFAGTVTAPTFKAGDNTLTESGLTIKDGPSITTNGIDAKDKEIKNIAAGTANNDAVNVLQLKKSLGLVDKDGKPITGADGNPLPTDKNGNVLMTSYEHTGKTPKTDDTIIGTLNKINSDGAKYFHINSDSGKANDSSAVGANAIAIGIGAKALADNTISIGTGNIVSGENSGAFGDPSIINAANSYSVGNNNKIGKIATGTDPQAKDEYTNNVFAFGNDITVVGTKDKTINNAIAIGSASTITGNDSIAIGTSAKASSANSIIVGSGAGTEVGANDANTKLWEKIKEDNKDLVGRFEAAANDTKQPTEYQIAFGTTAGQSVIGNSNIATGVGAGSMVVGTSNIATGKGAGQMVIGSANIATGNGAGVGVVGDGNIALGVDAGKGKESIIGSSRVLTPVKVNQTISIGTDSLATVDNAVAIGSNSVADRAGYKTDIFGKFSNENLNGKTYGAVSVGRNGKLRQIINVGDGVEATDAVNVRQLSKTQENLATLLYGVDADGKAKNIDPTTGLVTTPTVTKDADGKTTGGFDGKGATTLTGAFTNINTSISTLKGEQIHFVDINSDTTTAGNYNNDGATGDNAIAIGVNTTAQAQNAVAIGFNAHVKPATTSVANTTDGKFGVAIGAGTLVEGYKGVAIGNAAESKGLRGVSIGNSAGANSSADEKNTFVGAENTGAYSKGKLNSFFGTNAGYNAIGDENNFLGSYAGNNAKGNNNTYVGTNAGYYAGNRTGAKANANFNVAIGEMSGNGMVGSHNIISGNHAGEMLTGDSNIVSGLQAGYYIQGTGNIALGQWAATGIKVVNGAPELDNTKKVVGNFNTAIGLNAGSHVLSSQNIALGAGAGVNINTKGTVTSGNHIAIGVGAGSNLLSGNDSVSIG